MPDKTKVSVFGDTSTLHAAQPLMSFVKMWVGDQLLTSKFSGEFTKHASASENTGDHRAPEYIIDFSFVRINTSGQFKITLFDSQWTELETVLNHKNNDIKIQYGYVNGKQSPIYNAVLQRYTTTYSDIGCKILIDGIINGSSADVIPMTINTGTTNPSEAVKSICVAQGWQIGNFDETLDVDLPNLESFALIKEKPISYINLYIAPYAVRKSDGQSGFRLLLDQSANPPIAHFLPLISQSGEEKTYIYAKGINSSVVALSMTTEQIFSGAGLRQSATATESVAIADDGSTSSTETNVNEKSVVLGGISNMIEKAKEQVAVVSAGANTITMAKAASKYSLTQTPPFHGTLTILGDPEIKLGTFIRVLIPTSTGDLHYTSGVYLVLGISETIQGGKYLTDLTIARDGRDPITIDDVNILNYKRLIT